MWFPINVQSVLLKLIKLYHNARQTDRQTDSQDHIYSRADVRCLSPSDDRCERLQTKSVKKHLKPFNSTHQTYAIKIQLSNRTANTFNKWTGARQVSLLRLSWTTDKSRTATAQVTGLRGCAAWTIGLQWQSVAQNSTKSGLSTTYFSYTRKSANKS